MEPSKKHTDHTTQRAKEPGKDKDMVNTEKLSKYIEKAGTTWEALVNNFGGLPATLQRFAETFGEKAKAEDVYLIASELKIPAYQIGLVFFAPEQYGDDGHPQLAPLKEAGDGMVEVFASLSVRSQTKVLSLAFELQEAEAKEVAING